MTDYIKIPEENILKVTDTWVYEDHDLQKSTVCMIQGCQFHLAVSGDELRTSAEDRTLALPGGPNAKTSEGAITSSTWNPNHLG